MKSGTVKFYNKEKGYGFIFDQDSNEEVFVHATGLIDKGIKEGDTVQFEVIDGKKGINAVNVKLT